MCSLPHPGCLRKCFTNLPRNRLIALAVVTLFTLQLSRFYFTIQLDQFICYDANHTHQTGSPNAHGHQHEGEEALPHSHDDGFFFQHCKDTFDGIGLTPVQPLGVPLAVSCQPPMAVGTIAAREKPQLLEHFLPPPFQPPRSLS